MNKILLPFHGKSYKNSERGKSISQKEYKVLYDGHLSPVVLDFVLEKLGHFFSGSVLVY